MQKSTTCATSTPAAQQQQSAQHPVATKQKSSEPIGDAISKSIKNTFRQSESIV